MAQKAKMVNMKGISKSIPIKMEGVKVKNKDFKILLSGTPVRKATKRG